MFECRDKIIKAIDEECYWWPFLTNYNLFVPKNINNSLSKETKINFHYKLANFLSEKEGPIDKLEVRSELIRILDEENYWYTFLIGYLLFVPRDFDNPFCGEEKKKFFAKIAGVLLQESEEKMSDMFDRNALYMETKYDSVK
jgi:hypothetical protein